MNPVISYPKYLQVSVNKFLKNFLDSTSKDLIISQASQIETVLKSTSKKKELDFLYRKRKPCHI